jgi:hypothetical protein
LLAGTLPRRYYFDTQYTFKTAKLTSTVPRWPHFSPQKNYDQAIDEKIPMSVHNLVHPKKFSELVAVLKY